MRITVLLLFVLILSSILFLTQSSISHIAAEEGISTADMPTVYSGTYFSSVQTLANSSDGTSIAGLPSSQGSGGSGSFFDMFTTMKSWLSGVGSFLVGLLTVPKDVLFATGMPTDMAWALTIIMYGAAIFLLVSWLRWNF